MHAPTSLISNPSSKSIRSSIPRTRLTIVVHLSVLAIIPLTGSQAGCSKEAACAPWCAQTASRLAARDRVDKKPASPPSRRSGVGKRGWRTARVLRGVPIPLGGDESQPNCYLPVRNGDRRELGQGKTTLNPRYQPPGAISARRSSLSASSSRLSSSSSCARQRRYPTTSLKYLSSPGGLTRVKWYRDTWTVGLLIFRSKPLENSPSSRLKYRSK